MVGNRHVYRKANPEDFRERQRVLRDQLPKFTKQEQTPPIYIREYSSAVLEKGDWLSLFTDAGLTLDSISCHGAGIFRDCGNLQQFSEAIPSRKHRRKEIPEDSPAVTVTLTDEQFKTLKRFYSSGRGDGPTVTGH